MFLYSPTWMFYACVAFINGIMVAVNKKKVFIVSMKTDFSLSNYIDRDSVYNSNKRGKHLRGEFYL